MKIKPLPSQSWTALMFTDQQKHEAARVFRAAQGMRM